MGGLGGGGITFTNTVTKGYLEPRDWHVFLPRVFPHHERVLGLGRE